MGAVGLSAMPHDEKGLWCLSGGNDWWIDPEGHHVCAPCSGIPDPLEDDKAALALVKRFRLQIASYREQWNVSEAGRGSSALNDDLNRAIVLCAAGMGRK